jgi:hypothetical protein
MILTLSQLQDALSRTDASDYKGWGPHTTTEIHRVIYPAVGAPTDVERC